MAAPLTELFPRAIASFDARVRAVTPDQWDDDTPDDDWAVRDLVNHLVNEQLWAPETLGGKTMEEVGDRFEGDQVGDDPAGAWARASAASLATVAEPGALDRKVHLSRGVRPAHEYIAEMTADATIHAWDLARGIGADDALDPELVQFAYDMLLPMKDHLVKTGLFKAAIDVPDDAPLQTKLLAIVGRRA
jgi:uncharacterized protein (TIGR03086 family)